MADNAQKTPFVQSINEFARGRASAAIQQTGRALPCSVVKASGSIVQVKFEIEGPYTLPNVTVPVASPEYVRLPLQPGDKGLVAAADAYLGGVSGLGGGVADLTERGNLTALYFVPLGNTDFFNVDQNKLVLYGRPGVTIMDRGQNVIAVFDPAEIHIVTNGHPINIDLGGGTMNVTNGDVVVDGVSVKHHTHNQGPDGHGDAEVPTNPPNVG